MQGEEKMQHVGAVHLARIAAARVFLAEVSADEQHVFFVAGAQCGDKLAFPFQREVVPYAASGRIGALVLRALIGDARTCKTCAGLANIDVSAQCSQTVLHGVIQRIHFVFSVTGNDDGIGAVVQRKAGTV